MPNVGPWELFIILLVALIVFGPKKLPEIGKSLGRGLREFRRASHEVMNTIENELEEEPEPPKENTHHASASDRPD